jgi:hypothetical protein
MVFAEFFELLLKCVHLQSTLLAAFHHLNVETMLSQICDPRIRALATGFSEETIIADVGCELNCCRSSSLNAGCSVGSTAHSNEVAMTVSGEPRL